MQLLVQVNLLPIAHQFLLLHLRIVLQRIVLK